MRERIAAEYKDYARIRMKRQLLDRLAEPLLRTVHRVLRSLYQETAA